MTLRPLQAADAWAMGLALDEARRAVLTDDVPVGAVVVGPAGDVVGRDDDGAHRHVLGEHRATGLVEREPHRPRVGGLHRTESHGGIMAYGAR